jgi:hypothetical protein
LKRIFKSKQQFIQNQMTVKNVVSKFHITLKIGIIILVIGIGPLLFILPGDALGLLDAGNAAGPGILAFVTFWPAIALIVIGTIISLVKRNTTK